MIPRINIVHGLTYEDVNRWRWTISKLPTQRLVEKVIDTDSDEYKFLKTMGMSNSMKRQFDDYL
jgi:hypothetical protein